MHNEIFKGQISLFKSNDNALMYFISFLQFFEVFEAWEMEGGRNIYVSMVVFVTYIYLYLDQYEYIARCVNQCFTSPFNPF